MKTIIRTFNAGHKAGQKEFIGTCETWNEFLLIVEKYDPLFIDDEKIKDQSGNELDFYKHEDEYFIDLRDYSFKAERTKHCNYSNYGNDLQIYFDDALLISGRGDQTNNVSELMKKPYIKKQLDSLSSANLIRELFDYGAWNDDELSNHEENKMRWLWISCGDIIDDII